MCPTPSAIVPRGLQGALPSRAATFAALHCPFSQQTNPHAGAAGLSARGWFLGCFGESSTSQKLVAANMEQFTSGFYPRASLEGLTWVTKFLFWAFVLDDLVDETDAGRGPSAAASLMERLETVTRGAVPECPTPLESSLRELLDDLDPFLLPNEDEEFRESLRAYFGALVWEANNRTQSWVPDLPSYELFRPATGAVPPFWMLIGPIENVRLAPPEKNNPDIQRAQQLAGRVACWYNDLLSLEKEYANNDVHNLAIVLERHRYLTPSNAFDAAIAFCNGDVAEYCALAKLLIADKPSDALTQYLATLQSMMATTLLWTFNSTRYDDKDAVNATRSSGIPGASAHS